MRECQRRECVPASLRLLDNLQFKFGHVRGKYKTMHVQQKKKTASTRDGNHAPRHISYNFKKKEFYTK